MPIQAHAEVTQFAEVGQVRCGLRHGTGLPNERCKKSSAEHCCHCVGAEIKLTRPVEDKNPVVIGRLGRNPELPTVTFYGHYDVQPAMEREWTTDPFEVAAIDGYLYGRGTSDNKA